MPLGSEPITQLRGCRLMNTDGGSVHRRAKVLRQRPAPGGGRGPRKRTAVSRSPLIVSAPAASASSSEARPWATASAVPWSEVMTASGASSVPSTISKPAVGDDGAEVALAEPQLDARVEALGRAGSNSVRNERMWASKLIVASGPGSGSREPQVPSASSTGAISWPRSVSS